MRQTKAFSKACTEGQSGIYPATSEIDEVAGHREGDAHLSQCLGIGTNTTAHHQIPQKHHSRTAIRDGFSSGNEQPTANTRAKRNDLYIGTAQYLIAFDIKQQRNLREFDVG